jgi:hypothetical protein
MKSEFMGEMTGEICEGNVRDFWHPSHALSPLYKGVSKENVRDWPKTVQHITKTYKRTDFAIQAWQNRGYVHGDAFYESLRCLPRV